VSPTTESKLHARRLELLVAEVDRDVPGAGLVRGARDRAREGRVLEVAVDVNLLSRADVRADLDHQPGVGGKTAVLDHIRNDT
jgi:hypothetical protein